MSQLSPNLPADAAAPTHDVAPRSIDTVVPAADGEVIQLRRITEEFRPRGDLQRAAVESAVRTLAEQAQPGGVMRAPSESTPLRASAMRRARRLPEVEPLVVYHPREFWRKAFDLTWSESERGLDAGRKGRRRGWSEVHIGSYGQGLTELEQRLNTLRRDETDPREANLAASGRLSNAWFPFEAWRGSYSRAGLRELGPVGVRPTQWGALRHGADQPLVEDDVLGLSDTVYPVHAMGYNWLRPNAQSAVEVAGRIRELIAHYRELGQAQGASCDHVLVYTHSMGGLVARALMHPDMGGLSSTELGGVSFGAMPTHGAGTTYKRMRAGMAGDGGLELVRRILGQTAREMAPVVANASGPLELFPAGAYGDDWLRVRWIDAQGREQLKVLDVQRAINDPTCWWRVVNPEWVNPAKQDPGRASFQATAIRLGDAMQFHDDLAHVPSLANSHANFVNDPDKATWGNVTWCCIRPIPASADPDPSTWTLVHDDAKGTIRVRSHDVAFELKLQKPSDAGDGTVPAERSGAKVQVEGQLWEQTGYEHQEVYKVDQVLSATLYAMVRMDQRLHP